MALRSEVCRDALPFALRPRPHGGVYGTQSLFGATTHVASTAQRDLGGNCSLDTDTDFTVGVSIGLDDTL